MSHLASKLAIVTGGGRGIGRGVALALAAEGATVVVADMDEDAGRSTCAAAESCPKPTFRMLDIADPDQVDRFVRVVHEEFGRIDILVNNAGVTRQIDFFELQPADVNRILEVNVAGTFFMMQAVARIMRDAGGGRIVNMASIAGKGYRNTSNIAYAGSKGAIIAMTRVAAAKLGAFGVTVNAVCPGLTETELMSSWLHAKAAEMNRPVETLRADLLAESALRRMNSASDVAASVLFLVSEESRNITGQSLNVDGGIMWD